MGYSLQLFFFSSRRRHTRSLCDWSSDVCSSDLCEEMFVILDGEAQFTIDGRTSVLKGPAGAPCRMGHMHAIYNATDKPVQWMRSEERRVGKECRSRW